MALYGPAVTSGTDAARLDHMGNTLVANVVLTLVYSCTLTDHPQQPAIIIIYCNHKVAFYLLCRVIGSSQQVLKFFYAVVVTVS